MAGENPQTTLPPVPREPLISSNGRMSSQWERWIQQIQRVLSFSGGIAWQIINKAGAKLSDLPERTHAMLQSVLGWSSSADTAQDKHISDANGKKWEDHVNITDGNPHGTDHSMLDAVQVLDPASSDATKDKHLSNAQGKVWQDHVGLTNSNPHGTDHDQLDGLADDDHAQYLLLAGRAGQRAVTPLILGTAANNTTFESDGTVKLNGDATGWRDENFSAAVTAIGANAPTLVNWDTSAIQVPAFAHNVTKELQMIREFDHAGKEGAIVVHAHLFPTAAGAGTVKLFCEYYIKNDGLAAVAGTLNATLTLTGTAWEEQRLNLGTITNSLIAQGTQIGLRLYRLSTDPGTFANPVAISTWGYHYEIDTPAGSRQITAK